MVSQRTKALERDNVAFTLAVWKDGKGSSKPDKVSLDNYFNTISKIAKLNA